MNKPIVLKDVLYAGKVGGGVITGFNELDVLLPGALAIMDNKGELVTDLNAAALLADVSYVQVAVGRADDAPVIEIPRRAVSINRANYRAATKEVHTVGGATALLSLNFDTEGEAYVKVSDRSYTGRYNVQTVNATVYKRSYQTAEETVDALVAKLNVAESFVVAAKVGSDPNFGITITPKDDNTTIAVAIGGMFEGDSNTVTTAMVHSIGSGADILQMEKDATPEEGNSNPIDYNAEHYSRTMEADPAANYDVINIAWEGTHSSPTRSHNVMKNVLSVACVNGATAQSATLTMATLALVFASAYAAVAGTEPVTDTGTEHDGVAGN